MGKEGGILGQGLEVLRLTESWRAAKGGSGQRSYMDSPIAVPFSGLAIASANPAPEGRRRLAWFSVSPTSLHF